MFPENTSLPQGRFVKLRTSRKEITSTQLQGVLWNSTLPTSGNIATSWPKWPLLNLWGFHVLSTIAPTCLYLSFFFFLQLFFHWFVFLLPFLLPRFLFGFCTFWLWLQHEIQCCNRWVGVMWTEGYNFMKLQKSMKGNKSVFNAVWNHDVFNSTAHALENARFFER